MPALFRAGDGRASRDFKRAAVRNVPADHHLLACGEAALVDGYTRMQAFFKVVLPEAATGIAATAVFCFITAWNEYAFALIMTNRRAQTAPPFIPSQVGSGLPDWTVIASGTVLFLLPVAIFTFLLRNHLLRGMSFGAIRK
jgi:multiple sugar transport system permease protein